MGHKTKIPAAHAKETVDYDPLDCMLLWLTVLDGDEAEAALKPLGIDREELERLKRANPELLKRMRKLRICGRLMLRGQLAMLVRARLGEELMRCKDAKGIAQLTTAMSRMAGWMFWLKWDAVNGPPTEQQRINGEVPRNGDRLPRVV